MKKINKITSFAVTLILMFCSYCSLGQGMGSVIIPFAKDSFQLDDAAVSKLQAQLPNVNNYISKCYILIYPWSSVNETKKNSNIGILRAKAIIDFYEQKYSIPRKSFLIMDVNHMDDDEWMLLPDREGHVTFGERFCNHDKPD